MSATFDFIDSNGNQVSVRPEDIIHVARPIGNYSGELEIITGAKWGFGGEDRTNEYKRAKAAFELAHASKKKEEQ